ncbi:hypothetical protein [Streptomyces sp. NPDC002779]|uniref:hypothetical protein n=1 Tax=Streptomyces sp. NPDC002779 TaxID=3364664 RepID=UPI00367F05F5
MGGRAADSVCEKNGVVPVEIASAISEELVHVRTDFDVRFSSAVRTAFDMLVTEYGDGVRSPRTG